MTEKTVKIVKKGTKEFKETLTKFLMLFTKDNPEDTIIKGNIGMKTTQATDLPMPFGCSDLEVYIWTPEMTKDGKGAVAWFCSRLGCLCVCCREDFIKEEESYPKACPDLDEMFWDSYDEDYDPNYESLYDEWYEDY